MIKYKHIFIEYPREFRHFNLKLNSQELLQYYDGKNLIFNKKVLLNEQYYDYSTQNKEYIEQLFFNHRNFQHKKSDKKKKKN